MLTIAKHRLRDLAVARDDDALMLYINMGITELYRRFDLKIKSETVPINDNLALYELRSPDVLMLVGLYDKKGKELTQTDVIGDNSYDFKLVNYRSFLLRKPFNGYIYALYKASAIPLKDEDDLIDLPDAMLDALLAYITYSCHYTINRDNMNQADLFFKRFEMACQALDNQGYRIALSTERLSLAVKGFV